ncbi:hypothetical protein [Hyphomonas sp.]|uniref:hypothetical protein n=1 Tax=Hyphomonas sp. TaxID=87 RepID=UPI003918A3CD
MTDKKQRPHFSPEVRDQAVRMAVSDAELEKAVRSLARLIDRYGDAYWPLFERLEAELKERNSRKDRLNAYLPTNDTDSENPKRQTE